jgi:hypothetical protein
MPDLVHEQSFLRPPFAMEKTASLSADGRYRYRLGRRWADGGTTCLFVMLNPSTADATIDDPTIRRCANFARGWGHGALGVVNLYAFRATDPRDLWQAEDPVGPDNDRHIENAIADAAVVICAWGAHGHRSGRDRFVCDLIAAAGKVPHCLRVTKGGAPEHPLYLPRDLRPAVWDGAR